MEVINIVNGWEKNELYRCARTAVNIHSEISDYPITMLQAKRALISINYNNLKNYFSHDIIRMAWKK